MVNTTLYTVTFDPSDDKLQIAVDMVLTWSGLTKNMLVSFSRSLQMLPVLPLMDVPFPWESGIGDSSRSQNIK